MLLWLLPLFGFSSSILIAPPELNREIELDQTYPRHLSLSPADATEFSNMMIKKDFSVLMEFRQVENTRGTLYIVYSGQSKVLEFQSDGPRRELKAAWRRSSSISNFNIQNVELDDDEWHTLIFEIHGDNMRLTIDCLETGYSGSYPEIDFTLFERTRRPPQVWVTQRYSSDSMLLGKLKQFKIQKGSFYSKMCLSSAIDTFPEQDFNSESVSDLIRRVENMENEIIGFQRDNDNGSDVIYPTLGKCPDCFEYLMYRANFLETELKREQTHVQKLKTKLNEILMIQRGCHVNNINYENGESWTFNCTVCVCKSGAPVCKPTGCTKLSCRKPIKVDGQCCPVCGKPCVVNNTTYEHGDRYWTEPCVHCDCNDGEVSCAYQHTVQCPALNCSVENRVKPENQCCEICDNEDFCKTRPCHVDATCTKKKHGRDCVCNAGYFGDGEENCFDIDECKWDPAIAEQLGGCGAGSRCINTPGGFECECMPGYMKVNGRTCLDVIIL